MATSRRQESPTSTNVTQIVKDGESEAVAAHLEMIATIVNEETVDDEDDLEADHESGTGTTEIGTGTVTEIATVIETENALRSSVSDENDQNEVALPEVHVKALMILKHSYTLFLVFLGSRKRSRSRSPDSRKHKKSKKEKRDREKVEVKQEPEDE